jgi:UDP-3-O-[3-hydroxymyristoyl] glucosamine N-acyltransferase
MIRWPNGASWRERFPQLAGLQTPEIGAVCSLGRPASRALMFAAKLRADDVQRLAAVEGCLLLLPAASRAMAAPLEQRHAVVYCDDPRYEFARALDGLWTPESLRGPLRWDAARGLTLGDNVRLDPTATIEPGATVASDCELGPNVYVMSGARVGPRVRLGPRTVVRENAVVGGWGFGLALSPGRPTLRIPQIGGVQVGADVEIGALATVCSGTIEPTQIADRVKIDDHVHIGHNVRVANDVIATAAAVVGGSTRVGERTWLGLNCTILDRIAVGADCLIGVGAVVVPPLGAGRRVFGNPARPLAEFRPRDAAPPASRSSLSADADGPPPQP